MGFLRESDKLEIRKILKSMTDAVELILFTSDHNCQYCQDTKQLLKEVTALSEKIHLAEYGLRNDADEAYTYKIDKTPAIVIRGKNDYGIRYYGIPSGYELNSLLEDIVDISTDDSGFTMSQLEQINKIREPVHLQVFVTPACPYCPIAVRNAHRMAMVNENITSDMIEATEFPELSKRYRVRGVPRTMVNEDFNIDGGLPEDTFINQIVEYLESRISVKT